MLDAQSGGQINLYHNGSKKFETTSTGVSVTGDADISGQVTVGTNNSIFAENVLRFNPTGAAYIDHTTVGENINFRLSNASALDTTALTIASSGNATFAGDIVLGASSSIVLDDTPTASTASGSGTIVNWSVSESVTAGTLYAVKTNGGWTTADADSEVKSTYMLAIALGSNATAGMLLQGFFYKSSHGFTIGAPLYVSNTAGAFSNSRPTGSGDYVRIIGYATSTNYIYFDPDKTWVKIA